MLKIPNNLISQDVVAANPITGFSSKLSSTPKNKIFTPKAVFQEELNCNDHLKIDIY